MFGQRRSAQPPEDPAVALIEELLDAVAARDPVGDWSGPARHVLWICTCVTLDDAPDWIIFDTDDGVGWRRWPDDLPVAEVLHAPLEAAGHAAPLRFSYCFGEPRSILGEEAGIAAATPKSRSRCSAGSPVREWRISTCPTMPPSGLRLVLRPSGSSTKSRGSLSVRSA
jgi:hypothetical protein